jgi:hypothetical protein
MQTSNYWPVNINTGWKVPFLVTKLSCGMTHTHPRKTTTPPIAASNTTIAAGPAVRLTRANTPAHAQTRPPTTTRSPSNSSSTPRAQTETSPTSVAYIKTRSTSQRRPNVIHNKLRLFDRPATRHSLCHASRRSPWQREANMIHCAPSPLEILLL